MKAPLAVRALPVFAEKAWFTPPPLSGKVRARWESNLIGTQAVEVEVSGKVLEGYSIGHGPPVLLVHGWGGRASQMATVAKAIAEEGFRAIAINAPGHGQAKLATTNVFEMAEALEAAVEEFGPPVAVVAHSLGAMASIYAMGESLPPRVVLLAPVLDVEEVLELFSSRVGLLPWAASGLRRRIRRFIGDDWDRFRTGPGVDLGESEVLLVHDPGDPDTSFANSAAMAALRERTHLQVARSLGHNGILEDPATSRRVASFVAGRV